MEKTTMDEAEKLRIVLYSFGFKYGFPAGGNMVWDVRFLPNPYWVDELRPKTGKVTEVAEYVLQSSEGIAFLHHLEPLLQFLIEQHSAAGKKTVRIAIGCTGGGTGRLPSPKKLPLFCPTFRWK